VRKLQGMLGTTQSSTPPLPAEHVGSAVHDPSLTTGEALEKYSSAVQKVGAQSILVEGGDMHFDAFFVLSDAVGIRC
jgi:hypothetical protein